MMTLSDKLQRFEPSVFLVKEKHYIIGPKNLASALRCMGADHWYLGCDSVRHVKQVEGSWRNCDAGGDLSCALMLGLFLVSPYENRAQYPWLRAAAAREAGRLDEWHGGSGWARWFFARVGRLARPDDVACYDQGLAMAMFHKRKAPDYQFDTLEVHGRVFL